MTLNKTLISDLHGSVRAHSESMNDVADDGSKKIFRRDGMSEIQHVYRCFKCSLLKDYKEGEPVPICCDQPMVVETLPQCTSAPHAEMARNNDEDLPCDDGRGREFTKK